MAKCYMNMTSTLVMQSTQLSESLNKDLKIACYYIWIVHLFFLQYFESSKIDIRNRRLSMILGENYFS